MVDKPSGNIAPQIHFAEHSHDALAKRVLLRGFDGSDYADIASEDYDGGAKSAIAVHLTDAEAADSVAMSFFELSGTTVVGPAANTDRKKVAFLASKDNTGSVYVLTASTASYQLGIELEAGDFFSDSMPHVYAGGYWLRGSGAGQDVTAREWS